VIHSMICDPGRKTTSRSFFAFERLSGAGSDPPGNKFQLLLLTRYECTYDGRYTKYRGIRGYENTSLPTPLSINGLPCNPTTVQAFGSEDRSVAPAADARYFPPLPVYEIQGTQ